MEPRITDPGDALRYPGLTDHGLAMLRRLREHPYAPRFNNRSGHRLTPELLARVRDFEDEVLTSNVGWVPSTLPHWLDAFVTRAYSQVPHYRQYGHKPTRFGDVPTMRRADLTDIARFVPDDLPIDGLIHYSTSGTTGHPLTIASHPVVAASYVAFIKKAFATRGIALEAGRGEVGLVLIGWQRKCFTYVSVTPSMDESGLLKVNLHPVDWREGDDRARYLDDLAPEVISGDPISFEALLELGVSCRPKALISTSMMLMPALRATLERQFACPVFDFYSLNETGPVAFASHDGDDHQIVQNRLYVEILDEQDRACAAGTPGEVTLTGGFNPYLPLLRYRTGDRAELVFHRGTPALRNLSGRPPTVYRTASGDPINNVDVTHVLAPFALSQYTLHQDAGGALRFRVRGRHPIEPIRDALHGLFGAANEIKIETDVDFDGKVIQYTRAVQPSGSQIGEASVG